MPVAVWLCKISEFLNGNAMQSSSWWLEGKEHGGGIFSTMFSEPAIWAREGMKIETAVIMQVVQLCLTKNGTH